MFQLARSLTGPVIVTATSHLGAWQVDQADRHIVTDSPGPLEELEHGLQGVILVTGPLEGDRTRPVNEGLPAWLHEYCGYHAIPLLVEADGSRQKPLKAWAEHEPAVPAFADQVVQVAGLSALGKPLQEEHVHRVEIFSRRSGLTSRRHITAASDHTRPVAPGRWIEEYPCFCTQSRLIESSGYTGAAIGGKQNGQALTGIL